MDIDYAVLCTRQEYPVKMSKKLSQHIASFRPKLLTASLSERYYFVLQLLFN